MSSLARLFLLGLVILAPTFTTAAPVEKADDAKNCGCTCCTGKEVCCCHAAEAAAEKAKPEAPAGHPLRGVIVEIRADRQALLVKHEEIPGVMRAMTMLLRVDAPTLATVKVDQAITGILYKEDGAWWLRDVQPPP